MYGAGIGLEQSSTLYEVQRLFYKMQSFDANLLTGLKKRQVTQSFGLRSRINFFGKEEEHSKKKKVKLTRARTVFPARLLHSFGWDTASQWDLQDAHEMATVFLVIPPPPRQTTFLPNYLQRTPSIATVHLGLCSWANLFRRFIRLQ